MDARKTVSVQEGFEKIAAMGLHASEIFYAELFPIEPSLRAMFNGEMRDRLSALAFIVRALHRPEKMPARVMKEAAYGRAPALSEAAA